MRNRHAGTGSAGAVLWMIAVLLMMLVAAIAYSFYGAHGALKQNDAAIATTQVVTVNNDHVALVEKDTDSDGIPDWEETLWGTDSNNRDTDGDGVSDSRTLYTGDVNSLASTTTASSSSVPNELRVTSVATQELIGPYIAYAYAGKKTLTPEEQAVLVENSARVVADEFKPPVATLADIRVTTPSDTARVKYVNDMASVLSYFVENDHGDYVLMRDLAQEDTRQNAVAGLEQSIISYGTVIERLKTMFVPQDAAQNHVGMLTALMGYRYVIEDIKNMEQDPMRAALALQAVVVYDEKLSSAIEQVGHYMDTTATIQ